LSLNKGIFEIDYRKIKQKMNILTEEIMKKVFHPRKMNNYLCKYDYFI
jgi:hypothetical protein